jgi:acetyl-CoA C-acetyltransferase
MSSTAAAPVLVGIGVATQREEDPRQAREAIELMIAAVQLAADDAGSSTVLAGVQRIAVPRGRWSYRNPAGTIERAIGARRAVTVLSSVGVLQQTLIGDACKRIAAGEIDTAVVVGGDTGYRILRGQIAGVPVPEREDEGEPQVSLKPHEELRHPAELRAGMRMPVGLYAIIQSAYRAKHGWSIDEHRDRVAHLYSRFSQIAAANPHAWKREVLSPEAIRDASARNPMQAFPYTRLHCSTWNVDQASALLFCSQAKAETLGIPRDRWIFPLASTESNHMVPVSARADLGACPGAGLAGRAALTGAGLQPEEIDLVDLYSCFPVAVEVYAEELGLAHSRDLTVTGGMPFAGGPYNNYVLQATCRMAELLRRGDARTGLVSSVSGVVTKQAFGLWSRVAGEHPFAWADLSDEVAAHMRTKEVVEMYDGDGVIAGYTVLHDRSAAPKGIVVADIDGGRRTVAVTHDEAMIGALQSKEHCGAAVRFSADGTFCLTQ